MALAAPLRRNPSGNTGVGAGAGAGVFSLGSASRTSSSGSDLPPSGASRRPPVAGAGAGAGAAVVVDRPAPLSTGRLSGSAVAAQAGQFEEAARLRQIEIDAEDSTDSNPEEERKKQKRICSEDRKRARVTLLLLRDINKKVL